MKKKVHKYFTLSTTIDNDADMETRINHNMSYMECLGVLSHAVKVVNENHDKRMKEDSISPKPKSKKGKS